MKKQIYFLAVLSLTGILSSCFDETSNQPSFERESLDDTTSSSLDSVSGSETISTSVDTRNPIEIALEEDNLVTAYKDNVDEIIDYAFAKQASYPYSLTIMDGLAKSNTLGIKVDQEIEAATYYTPERNFNQNISSSNMVQTADRFYDDFSGNVVAYNGKTASDWSADMSSTTYTYDEYIQTYGKLIKSKYYCTYDDTNLVPDKYLTDDEEVYNASTDSDKHEVSGIMMYYFSDNSILSSTLTKTEEGYQLFVSLDPDLATSYYRIQMKKTGDLASYPEFTKSEITFTFDDELNLVSASCSDAYNAEKKVVITVSTTIEMTSNITFLHSDTSTFTYHNKTIDVEIPLMSEQAFNGFELIN